MSDRHSTWMALADLACQEPDQGRLVAQLPDGGSLSHVGFVALVDAWQRVFEARPEHSWALYLHAPSAFAAALLGAWHAGKSVVSPGDDLPATLDALNALGCGLAGDLPGGLQADDQTCEFPVIRRPLDAHQVTLKVFTSGSQGQAQAIDKTLAQLWSEVEALEQAFGPRLLADEAAAPVVWATVSHQHIYGLLFLVLWPLAAGRPMGSQRLLYPEDMIQALSRAPAVLVATPAHLKRLGEHLDWRAVQGSLRAVFSSGGPLPYDAAVEAARLMGAQPIEVFGSSETGGIAWRQASLSDTAWVPFNDVHWRIDEGCLSVCSPRLPDANWWTTSDLVEPAEGGSFRLLGRQDRIVKVEEKRVSLTAIEQALLATPWVQEARALVVPTPIGQRVGAVLVLSREGLDVLAEAGEASGNTALSRRLRQVLAVSFDAVALPRRWRFVTALPMNAQGKTPLSLLQDLFADTPSRPEWPAVSWLNRSETDALAVLDVHTGLSVFDGHFPKTPILPGVAQLDWVLRLGHTCFDLPKTFVRLEALKFVSPVVPGTKLYVSLQRKAKPMEPDLSVLLFRLYSQPGDDASQAATEHGGGRAVWRINKADEHV